MRWRVRRSGYMYQKGLERERDLISRDGGGKIGWRQFAGANSGRIQTENATEGMGRHSWTGGTVETATWVGRCKLASVMKRY